VQSAAAPRLPTPSKVDILLLFGAVLAEAQAQAVCEANGAKT